MKKKAAGPSPAELRLKQELQSARLELKRLKDGGPAPKVGGDAETLGRIEELERTRERLSRLYFAQLDENKRGGARLRGLMSALTEISADLETGSLLERVAAAVPVHLGFRIAFVRLRDPASDALRAVAFAGLGPHAQALLEARDLTVTEFESWLSEDCRVSRSYFISHKSETNQLATGGYVPDLGKREEWEWHSEDCLFVPLRDRAGVLVGYLSVDDPVDRLVPSQETIELLEAFATHATTAIENSRTVRQLSQRTLEQEAADVRSSEMSRLKGQFVSTISHELRTPLTAIQAFVDTLLATGTETLPAERLQHFLRVVDEESHRLGRLIESVLDLSRFDAGAHPMRRQVLALGPLLEEALGLLQGMAQTRQVDLKVECLIADTQLEADRDQLRQLILHLGSNAIKFTPAGGRVTVRLAGDARDLVLQVEDTGIGIPEEELDKIFDRFYQVDASLARRYGGSGLGLSICRSIVEEHGGEIRARSKPGQGSCFTVLLHRRLKPRVMVRAGLEASPRTCDVLRLAIEMVSETMNAGVVSLMAPEEDGSLVVQAALGLEDAVLREARVRPGVGVAGWVAEQRRPVCVSRPEEGAPGSGEPGRDKYRTGTFLSVALESQEGLLGVLNVTDPLSRKPFQPEDCNLLLELAETIASAWREARRADLGGVPEGDAAEAMRRVVEHVKQGSQKAPDRMRLARGIARELGLPDQEVSRIAFAATLHDVGMTMVDRRIVDGGQPLTDEERDQMRRHVEMGAEVLERFETLGTVRDIVMSHHEWWDGTGYPRGLEGREIPAGARVLALVDAWESMTRGRAHKAPRTREDAVAEIRRLRGQQFDPDVVDAFERVRPSLDSNSAVEGGIAATSQGR